MGHFSMVSYFKGFSAPKGQKTDTIKKRPILAFNLFWSSCGPNFGKAWKATSQKNLVARNSKFQRWIWTFLYGGCGPWDARRHLVMYPHQSNAFRFMTPDSLYDPYCPSIPPALSGADGSSGDAALGWRSIWPRQGHFHPSCLGEPQIILNQQIWASLVAGYWLSGILRGGCKYNKIHEMCRAPIGQIWLVIFWAQEARQMERI